MLDYIVKENTFQVMNRLGKQSCPAPPGIVGLSRVYQAQITVPLLHMHKPPQDNGENPPGESPRTQDMDNYETA